MKTARRENTVDVLRHYIRLGPEIEPATSEVGDGHVASHSDNWCSLPLRKKRTISKGLQYWATIFSVVF